MKENSQRDAKRPYQACASEANLAFPPQKQASKAQSTVMMPSIAARSPHHSRRRGTRRVQGDLNLDISSSLSEAEAAIFDLLLSAVKRSKCQTVVRVAGGWVRDKLLGLQVTRPRVVSSHSSLSRSMLFPNFDGPHSVFYEGSPSLWECCPRFIV